MQSSLVASTWQKEKLVSCLKQVFVKTQEGRKDEGKSRERAAERGYRQQAQPSARRFWKCKAGTLRISTQECSEATWGMLRLRKTRLMNWVDSWVYVTCLSLSFSICRLITRGVFQSRCEHVRESLTYRRKAANC